MRPEDLLRELKISGYSSRIAGEEVKVETCWFCANDRWNMELNGPRGVYHCWACGSSGRLDALLTRTLGGNYEIPIQLSGGNFLPGLHPKAPEFQHRPAEEVESATTYLRTRGFAPHIIRTYGLLVCVEEGHSLFNRILFPIREFWTNLIVGYAGRTYTGRHPKYLYDIDHRVIAGHRHRRASTPTIIVEGPMDGIAVHRAGFQAAVLSGISAARIEEFAASFHSLTPEPLIILLDGDAKDAARRLLWTLKPIHPAIQLDLPPGRDPADFSPRVLSEFLAKSLEERS